MIALITLLTVSVGIGMYSTYSSTLSGTTNVQVTSAELTGSKWLFDDHANSFFIFSINDEIGRYSDALFGHTQGFEIQYGYTKDMTSHFNITEKNSGYLLTNRTGYFIMSDYIKQRFTIFWPDNPYFPKAEIDTLNNNTKFNKIYDGGITIYEINLD